MPLLFLSFLFLTLAWVFWTVFWMVVWAVALLFWPVALLIAGIMVWRARMRRTPRRTAMHAGAAHDDEPAAARRNGASHHSAFEEYRQETLWRLDEESAKFREFLERLRRSRDGREFDAFMHARRARPAIAQRDASAG